MSVQMLTAAYLDRARALARWQRSKRALSRAAERLEDAPSQMLAGVRVWRMMTIDKHTGEERMQ